MRGHDETLSNETPENGANTFDYNENLHELQLINEILIETSQVEGTDRICNLVGKAVRKLNKTCYVLVFLYDGSINAVRIRATAGLEDLAEKVVGTPGKGFFDVSFRLGDIELNSQLLTSGKLEHFKDGLYALLAKKVPSETCKRIENVLNIGSILVIGFSNGEKIFGGISILVPEGEKVKNTFAIETMAALVSKKIQAIRMEKALFEAENRFKILF